MELNIESLLLETNKNLRKNILCLGLLFFGALLSIFLFILLGPEVDSSNKSVFLSFPDTNEEFLALTSLINLYIEASYIYVVCLFCLVYIFLQSFAIPGPIVLSIISGAIFGRWTGLFLVTICATSGSTICYFLSNKLGKGLVVRLFPDALQKTNKVVSENKDNLLYYLLFLRIVPIVPNWMINLLSPIIGIPIKVFIAATAAGLIPPNFIHITTGMAVQSLQQDGADNTPIYILVGIGILLLVPVLLNRRSKVKPKD